MARRKKRHVDMLPLLDIFMVVLFVFATIQEGRLDATTQESQQLSQQLDAAQAAVADLEQQIEEADIKEKEQKLQKTQSALESQRQQNLELTSELEQKQKDVADLEKLEKEAQQKLQEMEQKAQELKEQKYSSDDDYRQQDIIDKLLDQNSVFEVEIKGQVDPDEGIINICCYRDDPLSQNWRKCGQVPAQLGDREDWWRGGANGLLDVLRNTKGGNAMTIIRQDSSATFQIGAKVESLIRDQLPEQKVYNEGIALIEVQCE